MCNNMNNIKKASEDMYSFDYGGRPFYLKVNQTDDFLSLNLFEELKIRNIKLNQAKRHKIFNKCDTIVDLREAFERYLLQGNIQIVDDIGRYHLVIMNNANVIEEDNIFTCLNDDLISINNVLKNSLNLEVTFKRIAYLFDLALKKTTSDNSYYLYNHIDEIKHLRNDSLSKVIENHNYINNYSESLSEQLNLFKMKIDNLINTVDINCPNYVNKHSNTTIIVYKKDIMTPEEKLISNKNSKLIGTHNGRVNCLTLLPNDLIASASSDKAIKIWNIQNSTCVKTLEGHIKEINCLVLLSDNNLASGSVDKKIKIWDYTNNYMCIHTLTPSPFASIACLLVLKSGYLISGCDAGFITVWDNKRQYKNLKAIEAHRYKVTSLLNLLYDHFASGSEDYSIKIWDRRFNLIHQINVSDNSSIVSLLLFPNGYLAASLNCGAVGVWECRDRYKDVKLVSVVRSDSSVNCLSLYTDDYFLFGNNENIVICEINNDYQLDDEYYHICVLKGHLDSITSMLVLKDKTIVSCSRDCSIRIWK
jgi:WD40 repeat protein